MNEVLPRSGLVQFHFIGYHTAHFVLVVGADGKNYLATEVRYQPKHLLCDLANGLSNDFLWHPRRLQRIRSVHSNGYTAQGTRNRGVIYNTLVQQLVDGDLSWKEVGAKLPAAGYSLPHII